MGDCPERRHSGIVGNECADAIAKPSALYGGGHDVHFQPPAPDGYAYTHLYWLAAKDTDEDPSGRGAISPRLCALSDLKAKLKTEMYKSHRLGSAKTDTGYYNQGCCSTVYGNTVRYSKNSLPYFR